MKRSIILRNTICELVCIAVGCLLFAINAYSQRSTFTYTAYYPSPFGIFNTTRTGQISVGIGYMNETIPSDSMIVEGNVGIGTIIDPGAPKVAIQSTANEVYLSMGEDQAGGADGFEFQIAPGSGTPHSRVGYLRGNFGSTSGLYVYNQRNAPLRFGTNNSEQMRIDNAGYIGIGTTTPQTTQDGRATRLDVKNNIVTNDVYLRNPKKGAPRWVSDGFIPVVSNYHKADGYKDIGVHDVCLLAGFDGYDSEHSGGEEHCRVYKQNGTWHIQAKSDADNMTCYATCLDWH